MQPNGPRSAIRETRRRMTCRGGFETRPYRLQRKGEIIAHQKIRQITVQTPPSLPLFPRLVHRRADGCSDGDAYRYPNADVVQSCAYPYAQGESNADAQAHPAFLLLVFIRFLVHLLPLS